MNDRNNTIAGWVLGAGIVALGAGILSSEYFHAERPEKMGYPIEGVAEEGGSGAAKEDPIETRMAASDAAAGEKVFQKCAACHTATKGGANGVGPNLYNVIGEGIGVGAGGFAFSSALKAKGGTWDFAQMDEWLKSPRKFAEGTKMTFAGLSNGKDRADVIAYLNKQGDAPKPMPAAAAAPAAAEGDQTGGAEDGKSADTGAVPGTIAPGAPSADPAAAERAEGK